MLSVVKLAPIVKMTRVQVEHVSIQFLMRDSLPSGLEVVQERLQNLRDQMFFFLSDPSAKRQKRLLLPGLCDYVNARMYVEYDLTHARSDPRYSSSFVIHSWAPLCSLLSARIL